MTVRGLRRAHMLALNFATHPPAQPPTHLVYDLWPCPLPQRLLVDGREAQRNKLGAGGLRCTHRQAGCAGNRGAQAGVLCGNRGWRFGADAVVGEAAKHPGGSGVCRWCIFHQPSHPPGSGPTGGQGRSPAGCRRRHARPTSRRTPPTASGRWPGSACPAGGQPGTAQEDVWDVGIVHVQACGGGGGLAAVALATNPEGMLLSIRGIVRGTCQEPFQTCTDARTHASAHMHTHLSRQLVRQQKRKAPELGAGCHVGLGALQQGSHAVVQRGQGWQEKAGAGARQGRARHCTAGEEGGRVSTLTMARAARQAPRVGTVVVARQVECCRGKRAWRATTAQEVGGPPMHCVIM